MKAPHWIRKIKFRIKNGLTCCDIYGYQWYLAKKIASDLKVYKKNNMAYPMGMKEGEWDIVLDKMIYAFDLIVREGDGEDMDDLHYKAMNEGTELFGKYFKDLWI